MPRIHKDRPPTYSNARTSRTVAAEGEKAPTGAPKKAPAAKRKATTVKKATTR